MVSVLEDAMTQDNLFDTIVHQPSRENKLPLQFNVQQLSREESKWTTRGNQKPSKPPQKTKELHPNKETKWTRPYVHIINTRFMQQQGNLTDLGRARLVLFETFCLETVLSQTVWNSYTEEESPPLLWIIKTDPDLDPEVRLEMINLVNPYPWIYLVASNVNFCGWRGGEAGEDLFRSKIYTGDLEWLRQAHEIREERAILETRLDADDGLNVRFVQVVHEEALRKLKCSKDQLQDNNRLKWRYWCTQSHLEWNPTPIFGKTQHAEHGLFLRQTAENFCVTAGLTVGVSVGETEQSVPRYPHHTLYQELKIKQEHPGCGVESKCIRMMTEPKFGALRSRTATSAGMKNVATKENDIKMLQDYAVPGNHKGIASTLKNCFHVNLTKVARANRYVQDHLAVIVEENLQGQCTDGHSCKQSSREALENLLHVAGKEPVIKL